MCGIASVATRASAPPRELIGRMCDAMRHRGPDGEGMFLAPGIGLGMRRLAVLDLLTGDQPVANAAGGSARADRFGAGIELPGVRVHAA